MAPKHGDPFFTEAVDKAVQDLGSNLHDALKTSVDKLIEAMPGLHVTSSLTGNKLHRLSAEAVCHAAVSSFAPPNLGRSAPNYPPPFLMPGLWLGTKNRIVRVYWDVGLPGWRIQSSTQIEHGFDSTYDLTQPTCPLGVVAFWTRAQVTKYMNEPSRDGVREANVIQWPAPPDHRVIIRNATVINRSGRLLLRNRARRIAP